MLKDRKLILASHSPRRQEYLALLGISYECIDPSIDEAAVRVKLPHKRVMKLAENKARAVAKQLDADAFILGADTLVVVKDQVLGKPKDIQEARTMLQMLSGKKHSVYTGICLVDNNTGQSLCDYQRTTVQFAELSESEIDRYLSTQEPMDKAGAYAIQGRGSAYVLGIHGCYFNVLGLPIRKVYEMFLRVGLM